MVDYFDANAVGSAGGDNVAPSAIGTSATAATNGGDAGMEDEIMVSRSISAPLSVLTAFSDCQEWLDE